MIDEAERLARRMPALAARARIVRALRAFFEAEDFLEVETPARVRSPGQELHLDAVPAGGDRWLVTSPEYHMKRLLGAGLRRIVQIGRCWRADERGPQHEPEFTMIEWYRAGAPLEAIAGDCERLVATALAVAGRPPPIFSRTTVRALCARHAGVDIEGDESAAALRAKLVAASVDPRGATAWDDLFFQLWLDRVDPKLGREPTLVFDWPAPLGALARRRPDDPRWVERFELYAGGLELANAFGELTDPVEQRARFVAESHLRAARGKVVYPIDERLLEALARMPPSAGVALGLDRLVMYALGAATLREVMAFADDEV